MFPCLHEISRHNQTELESVSPSTQVAASLNKNTNLNKQKLVKLDHFPPKISAEETESTMEPPASN